MAGKVYTKSKKNHSNSKVFPEMRSNPTNVIESLLRSKEKRMFIRNRKDLECEIFCSPHSKGSSNSEVISYMLTVVFHNRS